ncbi:hypothetical protein CASFOL_035895 [Castilleja foliolosa]|uniref:Uncharacterized protein n=1 Tax=Castilleja foliolosa TaxID=1961234 RepID=A0ABD3BU01_9LAMI
MDRIRDELDEVKLEAEKLRDECRAKTELYQSLKKSQAEQLTKSRQDTLEIDKLSRELNVKSVEISEIRQMYEELQFSLQRKDVFLQQISSSNEKLRLEHGDKISKLENENRDLVSSLDEASSRIQDLEERTRASSEEIAALKRVLSVKTETDFHEEEQKNLSRDLKQRDDYILKLEEENRVFQDKLKWKNEQFFHLQEAHGRVRAQFESSKTEWEKEKTSFIDEISKLQTSLDAEVRISENLETQLRLSNRALASEQSQRKAVEIELFESRARLENVVLDCQVAKSEIEELTVKRDEEIAELQMLLRKKERVENEMKYKTEQLERENAELLVSLKDIQKAQINVTSSSLKKLQSKLESLEKLHSKCRVNIKEKDDKWNSEKDKITVALKNCVFELDCKNKCIRELHEEVDVKNEEISVLIMVLKSEFYVANSKLKVGFSQIEEKNVVLNQQLQKKNDELQKVRDERDEIKKELAEKEAANIVLLNAQNILEQENKKFSLNIKEKGQRLQESQKDFEEKNRIIVKLEKEVNCLREELEFQGKSNVQSKQEALQLEALLQTKISEIQELKSRLVEHESDKQAFLKDFRKLSIDKENLLTQLKGICRKIEILCGEDVGLVSMLGKMLYVSEENGEPENNILSSDGLDDIITFSLSSKLVQVMLDERAPLTELNS